MRYLLLLFIVFLTAQAWAEEIPISQITEAIEQASPDSKHQYYQFRARAYSKKNMPRDALADLTTSINLNPTISAYRERTEILVKMGRYQEAINDLDIILETVPGDLEMSRLRSKTYFKMEQYKETLDDLDIILESAPGDLEMYRLRSKTYFKIDEYNKAMEDARRVLAAIPNDKVSRLIVMESTTALLPKKDIIMGAEKGRSSGKRKVARKKARKKVRKLSMKPLFPSRRASARSKKTSTKPRTARKS